MNITIQIIGLLSATLTTASFIPQAIKTWRTRSTSDLSPLMFGLFCLGVVGWLIYGIFTSDLPIILANAVTICFAGIIMYFILSQNKSSKLAHIGLYVDDLEKMKSFYCNAFFAKAGKIYLNKNKKFSSCFLTFPSGTRIELMHQEDIIKMNDSPQWGHLAISVGSKKKVNTVTDNFKNTAIKIIAEPRDTGDGYYESVVADPEGNHIEITI